MLRKIIAFSLNNALLVILSALAILVVAIVCLPKIPVDVFPELNAPRVVILSEAGGLNADEVEQYVTFPIESAVNGLPGVNRVRSSSAMSLSIVWVEFDWDVDIYRARQLVSEKLDTARKSLPENVESEIGPVSSITGEVMLISLRSKSGNTSPADVRSIGEFDLRNKLLSIKGVAQVVAIGGSLPEYQINVDPERLRLYDLTIDDVIKAAGGSHSVESAGYLPNDGGQELPIRQSAAVTNVDDIKNTAIRHKQDSVLTIGQVADVKLGPALKRGTAADKGHDAVVLSIQKSPGTNTIILTKAIDEVLDGFQAGLDEDVVLNRFAFRQADFINLSVDNLKSILRDAVIIVAVIVALFLMNVRTTIITLTAIPLSLALAILALWAMDYTINVMTLGGLAVAIGELVDDAIIGVENVYRRLRENQKLPEDKRDKFLRIVFAANNEIRSAVIFATVIIVLVFVPLLFFQGLEGRFFRPLGVAYIIAVASSLIVALTVTPALCRYLLRGRLGNPDREGWFVRILKRIYEPTLEFVLRFRKSVMLAALIAAGCAVLVASTFGTSFLPEFNEGSFTVFLMAPPGTSLYESDRLAKGVEKKLANLEGVRSVVRRTGRAERDEHAEPVSTSEVDISIEQGYDKHVVLGEVKKIINSLPGITTMVGQPIEHRLSHIMSGTPAAIAINVYGENMDVLRHIAKEIEAELKQIEGATDVMANRELMIKTLPISYRRHDLARWNLTVSQAAEQLGAAFHGAVVDTVNQGIRKYDIVVRLKPELRASAADVRNFQLRAGDGKIVALHEVADIGPEMASNLIARENTHRKAVVSCNVADGYNLGHLIRKVQEKVDPIVHRYGCSVNYGGQFEAQQSATRMILITGSIVIILIMMLLNAAIGDMAATLLVMINLPLALIGGVIAVYVTDSGDLFANTLAMLGLSSQKYHAPVLSIASIVGFITLLGIAVRNGLLLVNQYSHLIHKENMELREAIITGSKQRLVPILMTALTGALGLLPMVLSGDKPGGELLAPLAVVGLGGLTTSTLLNLLVIPAGYRLIFSRRKPGMPGAEEVFDYKTLDFNME